MAATTTVAELPRPEATVRYFMANFKKMNVVVKADHLFVDCMSAAAARMDGEMKFK